jgi:hypothetical protein
MINGFKTFPDAFIIKKYRRRVELQDFPYLEVAFKQEHSAFDLWFAVVNRVAPAHWKTLIASIVKDAKSYEQTLNFELFEKYNFHWKQIEDVKKWHELEPNTIFVCDEAQEYFLVRIKEKARSILPLSNVIDIRLLMFT